MTLFDYYLQYMTELWEGKRPAPEGITLPEGGDENGRIQALGQQLQAMGMASFVRACAAQDGTELPEELFKESGDLGGLRRFSGMWTMERVRPNLRLHPNRTVMRTSTPLRCCWTASPWTMGWYNI